MCNEELYIFLLSKILCIPFKYSMPNSVPAHNSYVPNRNKYIPYEDNDILQRIKKNVAKSQFSTNAL